jgi:drug/metabolite transporter (DMT)-like permease
VWIFIALSGFFLAAYMAALAGAYRTGDISIAYPLARSLPVIFVFMITLIFGKGKPLGTWAIIGIILVVSGCLILPLKGFYEFRFSNYKNLCCVLAVLAAVGISGYTVTDDAALRNLREIPVTPWNPVDATLVYMVLEGISCSVWQFLIVAYDSRERKIIIDVLRGFKGAAAITGIGIYLTYGLVLASMNYVTNVSYVAAFRQLSIPLGAMLGMVLLKEPRYVPKLIGVVTIFVGLIIVGTA